MLASWYILSTIYTYPGVIVIVSNFLGVKLEALEIPDPILLYKYDPIIIFKFNLIV